MNYKIVSLVFLATVASGCGGQLKLFGPGRGEGGCTVTPIVVSDSQGNYVATTDRVECSVATPIGPEEPGNFSILRSGDDDLSVRLLTGMGGVDVPSVAAAMAGPWQFVGLVVVLVGIGTLVLKYLPMGPIVSPIKLLLGDLPKNASFMVIGSGVAIAFVPVVFERFAWVPIVAALAVGGYFLWEWRSNNSTRKVHEANGNGAS